jgi:copper chaperone CopZ
VATLSLKLPALYGDHHVTEVRQILGRLPGVADVYASSAFQMVEVTFDEQQVSAARLEAALAEAGYLGELPVPVERGALAERPNGDKPFFRHTAAYEQLGRAVHFAQEVPASDRPLWPCPGLGALSRPEVEKEEDRG